MELVINSKLYECLALLLLFLFLVRFHVYENAFNILKSLFLICVTRILNLIFLFDRLFIRNKLAT